MKTLNVLKTPILDETGLNWKTELVSVKKCRFQRPRYIPGFRNKKRIDFTSEKDK